MDLLRMIVVVAVVGLLILRGRTAWRERALALAVWRRIRARHVAGSLLMLAGVLAVAVSLLTFVPVTQLGLGSLIGLDGNAVFAPIAPALEAPLDAAEQAAATGVAAPGIPWTHVAGVSGFLLLLCLLFPVLAYAEELVFRHGWEDRSTAHRVAGALWFGMVHLVMLIPLAAALAVALAGWVYGTIYLRAFRAAALVEPPAVEVRSGAAEGEDQVAIPARTPPAHNVLEARREAVMAATVWHTTFNTTVAVIVLLGYLLSL